MGAVLFPLAQTEAPMVDDIEIHFNGMGYSGGTLVVVAIGTDVYGATDREPVAALYAAASRAANDRASLGRPVNAKDIVERGLNRIRLGLGRVR